MKISRLFNSFRKRLATGTLVALAVALPVAASAADMVKFSATTGVANVTAGDTTYGPSVSAKYNEVVKVEVTYDNNEEPSSTKTVNNLHVKINVPSTPGVNQTVTTTTSGDNITTVNGSVKVQLDGQDAYLQYIPGTAEWKHASTANGPMVVEQKISDSVVTDPNGINLGTENPCQAGAVAVSLGVMVPGVKVVKESELLGQTGKWSNNNTANPGDTLKYKITYQNTGNTVENNVIVRDNLPPDMTLVPNTTLVYTTTTPNGDPDPSNNITGGGINIGSYQPTGGAYVTFEVKVPGANALTCGDNVFRNVGIAYPKGWNQYYNIAVTTVHKTCSPSTPVYSCDAFHVAVGGNKTVAVDKFTTTATNGATFKNVVIDWGDQSTPLTTNNAVGQTHPYTGVGPYTVTAVAHFSLNGKDVTNAGSCTQTISFNTPGTPPNQLPNTGAGNVIGLFAGTVLAGTIGYRLFLSRKLARR